MAEDSIAIYRWNEIDKEQYFVGRGEYNGKLPVGRNRITLENLDGVSCQYNMFVNEGTNNPPARFLFTRKLLIHSVVSVNPDNLLSPFSSAFS